MNVQQQPHYIKAGTLVSDLEVLDLVESSGSGSVDSSEDTATLVKSVTTSSVQDDEALEYIEKLVKKVDAAMPESAASELRKLLLVYRHIFCETETDMDRTNVKHRHGIC